MSGVPKTPGLSDRQDIQKITERVQAATFGDLQPIDTGAFEGQALELATSVNLLITRADEIVRASEFTAMQDGLTGLPNRTFLRQELDRALSEQDGALSTALIYIDLDGFKSVNDSLGHAKGDQLLQLFADRMRKLVQHTLATFDNDAPTLSAATKKGGGHKKEGRICFARIGGDEFAVLLRAKDAAAHAETFAKRLMRVVKEPFLMQGYTFSIGASMGICCDESSSAAEHLRRADAAMYTAKQKGRNQYCFYDADIENQVKMRFAVATQLRHALKNDEFRLVFQPQCSIHNASAPLASGNCVASAEALLRWDHPTRGSLSPASFIDIAEEMGLITEIGRWVIKEAAYVISKLQDLRLERRISINMSPSDLRQDDIVDFVRTSLVANNARPDLLEIEITESVVMSNDKLIEDRINALRRLGITFAIDDFGTGYSNLSRLTELPIDRLKIDRSLIRDLVARADHRTIVQSVVNLAHGLKLEVVAEGIETPGQLQLLQVLDCDVAQGFYFGSPMNQEDFIALLETNEAPREGEGFAKVVNS